MDFMKMLSELRAERETIEEAIITLERLARGSGKRRGRPPKWMAAPRAEEPQVHEPTTRKRSLSPEARARMAEAQKRRWAAARGGSGE